MNVMIPLHLKITGFLSYKDPAEIDFTAIDLACIAGANGAGKSSLLDAITWALFGQARKRDESIINLHPEVKAAEVTFTFAYESNIYRIQRTTPRGKTSLLEFHILKDDGRRSSAGRTETADDSSNGRSPMVYRLSSGAWKPLTEHTSRETQARIEATLRLDYETFVNASFFLQGKADQFTQQRPGDRKRILGNILGLEVWEEYRQRAAERRKAVEAEISALEGRLHEIGAELAEESARRARLKELEAELAGIAQSRAAQEAALENIRKNAAMLEAQAQMVATLDRQLQGAAQRLRELETRRAARQQDKDRFDRIIGRAEAIEAAYQAWQQARTDIEYWDIIAQRVREVEKNRQAPLLEINTARARLEQEQATLVAQRQSVEAQADAGDGLQEQVEAERAAAAQVQGQLDRRPAMEAELQASRQRMSDARVENPRLKAEMDNLKERIDQLGQIEGAACPVCGQPLTPAHRQVLVAELTAQGRELGDRFRANRTALQDLEKTVGDLETALASLTLLETNLRAHTRSADQLLNRIEAAQQAAGDWQLAGAPRLAEVAAALEGETFAAEARARLAEVDAELKAIGYDTAAHDAARKAEAAGRPADQEQRQLENARSALGPLEREIAEIKAQIAQHKAEVDRQQVEYDEAAARLAAAQAGAPDLDAAERSLFLLQEQENRLRMECGAAQQKVAILQDLKKRRAALEAQREVLARRSGQFKQLERAFGKDGVPALLIEQALPQIEAKANEILDRLSGGSMSVRFITQAAYKDKKRGDLKETLDILISDGAGARDYELYSGGEAFRVNFAIRLALSEVLAQRAGARLQTLVIDEGFGSQDAQGRQKLIEAINLVRGDFAKILVITHIDELKDAFPTRIEIEKTLRGSVVRVV